MSPRKLKIHRHPAAKSNGRPPLLFIHGGYTHSLCWQVNFIPFLNAQGYDCYALDLPATAQVPVMSSSTNSGWPITPTI
jgi:pimeloyl-ACP methyl ester carboxylesterase